MNGTDVPGVSRVTFVEYLDAEPSLELWAPGEGGREEVLREKEGLYYFYVRFENPNLGENRDDVDFSVSFYREIATSQKNPFL